MKEIYKLAVCGGDARLLRSAELFAAAGCDCRLWGCVKGECEGVSRHTDLRRAVSGVSAVILPIPAFRGDGTLQCNVDISNVPDAEGLFSMLEGGTLVFAGKTTGLIRRLAAEFNLAVTDYGEREEFSIQNAVPTAEAAILIAMDKLEATIDGGRFAVFGYGRCGSALAKRLRALGGDVTVAARSPGARAAAASDAMKAASAEELFEGLHSIDCVFNTVPHRIITADGVSALGETLIVDLASLPGGLTEEARAAAGDRYIEALSLPGRYFPLTAGEIIYKTVLGVLREKGVEI